MLDAWGVTLRETMYSADKSITSHNGNPPYTDNSQPSVGITDLEGRYNFTESLQLAIGGNNIFGIKAKHNCIEPTPNGNGGGITCNTYGSVNYSPVGTPFDPYGGYYYGRVTYRMVRSA